MKTSVVFENVIKELRKLPHFIVRKLNKWARDVEKFGIEEIRKIPGYHDEPLRGQRQGQRSIRLSKGYRAIYVEYEEGNIKIVSIEEVSKHEY
ncbi:MAG: type II toxin-antitoxin system mRNA interferase toxin, RelE/StbE family [Bdellovibrionales bacterium]